MQVRSLLAGFSEVRPARSVFFFALGGIVGLALAGYGLFTARGTATHTVPPEDVALINQRPILRSDYIAQLQQVFGVSLSDATPAQRRQILADMIHEELFVQRGLELDMPGSDPDTRSALVAAVDQQVIADVVTRQPDDAVLRAYYQAHQADYSSFGSMTVHDLIQMAPTPGAIEDAAAALRRGSDLATVLTTYGLKESGKLSGEELYFAAKIHLGDTLFASAAALHDHEIAGPIRAADGLHLLVMERNVPPVPLSFEVARDQVLNDYRQAETKRLTDEENRFLNEHADILIAPDFR